MSFCLNSACLLAMASLLLGVDGYCQYRWIRCYSKSVDLTNMVYVESYFYNKLEYLVFNSTVDQYVGYTDFGKNLAISKNEERSLTYERLSSKAHCQFHAKLHKTIGLNRTVEPSVKVKLVTPFGNGQHPMMVCSAYNFYPRMINLTWYRDGQKVTSDVSTTQLANGDWFYQIHSYVKLNPKAGEKISCVLEHASFKEPREFVWDSSALEADRNKVALGAFGLVLGLVVCAAGLLYYRKKTQGFPFPEVAQYPTTATLTSESHQESSDLDQTNTAASGPPLESSMREATQLLDEAMQKLSPNCALQCPVAAIAGPLRTSDDC